MNTLLISPLAMLGISEVIVVLAVLALLASMVVAGIAVIGFAIHRFSRNRSPHTLEAPPVLSREPCQKQA